MSRPNSWEGLIDQWDERLRKAFLDAVYLMRNAADIAKIAERLEKGDVDGALRAVGLDPAQFRVFDKTLADAFEAGGVQTAKSLPPLRDRNGFKVIFQFNVRNPAAEAWLKKHSGDLIRDVFDDQKQMIRDVLADGMSKGVNPRTAALDLVGRVDASGRRQAGLIGLTSSQEKWSRNYVVELQTDPAASLQRLMRDKRFDSVVRLAAASDTPIPAETRQKMVAAYRNRALRYRAESIARTEAMSALHEAQQQAMTGALGSGSVEADQIEFVWRTARDKRVRDSHRPMNGQTQPYGQMFTTGSGAKLRWPGDEMGPASETINCRCWREPKVDFLRGIR